MGMRYDVVWAFSESGAQRTGHTDMHRFKVKSNVCQAAERHILVESTMRLRRDETAISARRDDDEKQQLLFDA